MTTLQSGMPEEFGGIGERLERIGGRFRQARVLGALGRFVAVVVPVMVGVLFVIGFFNLPGWMNMGLGMAAAGVAVLAYVRVLHRLIWERPTYAQIARWVEEEAGGTKTALDNELINAVLLAQEYEASSKAMAERKQANRASPWIPHVLREIERKTAGVDFGSTVPWKKQRRSWGWAAGMGVLSLFVVVLSPGTFAHGFAVLLTPGKFVPRVGSVKIIGVEPGNDHVLAGQSLNFTVSVEAPAGKVVEAKIELHYASGKDATYPMIGFGGNNTQYRYSLPTVAENVDYMITAGDTQSERYHVEVLPEIHLVGYKLVATPPLYTGLKAQTVVVAGKDLTAAKGSLEVPMGSSVEVTAGLDIPVKEALMDMAGANPAPMELAGDKTFSRTLAIRETVRFGLRINDGANRTLRRFPDEGDAAGSAGGASYFVITATADQPPTVQVTEPARDLDAKPGEKVMLAAQGTDDYGLTEMRLETAKGSDGEFVVVKKWAVGAGAEGKPTRNFVVKHVLELPAEQYKFGDTVRYRFVAVDNRNLLGMSSDLGMQTTQGQVFSINFNDTAAAMAKTTKTWDELRKLLTAVLEKQVKLREDAKGFTGQSTIEEAKKLGAAIGEGQTGIRAEMGKIAKEFPFEPSMKLIQKSLQVLVTEDATGAVDRAGDIVMLSETKALGPIATRLRQHESRIIDVLQALLAISANDEKKAEDLVHKDGEKMPDEAKQAWQKLADDLKKFEKEQKKVIDSTADLAKKPKDQYDQNDKDKLKEAMAVEDKWEKFMSQRMVDLSKIGEQDQANKTMLEEVVQMKVELAMAKNALATKATEIATPLEENGLENAKALDTHIERWLMQTPDRTKWEMEEAVKQNDTPAVELPKQLQDMVGDLMDKEEDLTDEMESQGSKFNDSLNKGAGWDASDGPISNMSAQGVTGNQLPKNMEIQGRSGEGREGRSSGEMVGSAAEGKGGRRTPTRMTGDPFGSGKIDDKSKDPAGGATGGGKKAGFGGEGLEGQAPEDSPVDPSQRLQGKQAALRNQAERIQIQMHAQGFNNFKLIEAAVLMQKADESLKANRYNNALYYQQQAVQSLNTAKVLAAGQVHVTMDTTPTMDGKTQKEMGDALNGVMPKGYADPVKAYFQKLSEGAGE